MRTRAVLAVMALGMALGVSVPASAQSATVCVSAHVIVNGEAIVDQDQTCNTVPPAAP